MLQHCAAPMGEGAGAQPGSAEGTGSMRIRTTWGSRVFEPPSTSVRRRDVALERVRRGLPARVMTSVIPAGKQSISELADSLPASASLLILGARVGGVARSSRLGRAGPACARAMRPRRNTIVPPQRWAEQRPVRRSETGPSQPARRQLQRGSGPEH